MVDDIIISFLKEFKSKNTIRNYRIALRDYFNAIQVNDPNTYFTSGRDYEQDVKTFNKSVEKLAPKTYAGKISAIRSFFEENKAVFPNHVVKKFKKRVIGSYIPITRDQVFTKQQLKEILADGDIRARAFFLTLASSGLRPGELLGLRLQDIDFTHEPVKITIPRQQSKNKAERITFVSDEAKQYLELWIDNKREQYIRSYYRMNDNFKQSMKKKPSFDEWLKIDDRVFPFSVQKAWQLFHRLLKQSGHDKTVITDHKGSKRRAFHLHTFRKYTRSNLPPKMPVDMVEQLLGHSGYLTDEYRKYDDNTLAKYYLEAMDSVSIFESQPDLTEVNEEIKDLKTENERLKRQMDDMNRNMINLLAKMEAQRK